MSTALLLIVGLVIAGGLVAVVRGTLPAVLHELAS